MELTDLATIRTLCEKYDFALSKGFGQNFIVNPGLVFGSGHPLPGPDANSQQGVSTPSSCLRPGNCDP